MFLFRFAVGPYLFLAFFIALFSYWIFFLFIFSHSQRAKQNFP